LSAVQDGPALHGALEQARGNYPQALRSARPTTGDVVFLAPDRAAVIFQISYADGMNLEEQIGYAVFVDNAWKVARETYCTVLSWAGGSCPPPN
jgi:hypothetical protein